MNFLRILAIAQKETLQALRYPATFLIAFLFPLLLLFLMGYALNLDIKNLNIGVFNATNDKSVNELLGKISANKYFNLRSAQSAENLKEELEKKEIVIFLLIRNNGPKLEFSIFADGSYPNQALVATQYLEGIIKGWQSEFLKNSKQSQIIQRLWFNESANSWNFLIPGSTAIIITLIGTLLTSLIIAREYEQGNTEVLFTTPLKIGEFIIGKILPYFILAMLSMLLCVMVARFWYEVPFRGSFVLLFVLGGIYTLCSLGIGLFISAATKNQFLAAQISMIAGFLPTFILSGYIFEVENMQKIIQPLTYIVPAKYYINIINDLFLVGNLYQNYAENLAILLCFTIFIFVILKSKVRRRLDE